MSRDDDFDDLDISRRAPRSDGDLTTVDWLLCIFCSGIGCIVGIVLVIQGNPKGGKMLGLSLLFMMIWTVVRLMLTALSQQRF